MDRDLSAKLTGRMPIVAHEMITGLDCGALHHRCRRGTATSKLRCNERGVVVGVVQIDILRGLLGRDGAT